MRFCWEEKISPDPQFLHFIEKNWQMKARLAYFAFFRAWLKWCLLVGVLCCGLPGRLAVAAPQDRQDWAQASAFLSLTPAMRYFKEAPGQSLDWRQALAADAWQDADPEGMAALHKSATMWMLVEVENTSSIAQTRWVVVHYWALMDAQLFVLDAQSPNLLAHQRSGQKLAPAQRDLDTEQGAFSVTLQPGQRARLLLRVSDLYWSHMVVNAWEGSAYTRTTAHGKLVYAVILGAVLALSVVLLLPRERNLALVAAWMVLSYLLEISYAGLLAEFVVPARLVAPVMLLLFLGALINSASAFVVMYFLELNTHRFWYRWNWVLFVTALLLTLAVLGTRSNGMRQAMSLLNLLMVLSNLTMLIWARIRGNRLRQLMVAVMAVNFSLAVVRTVVRQFYVPPDIFQTLAGSVAMVKGCLVLLVIALVVMQRQRDQQALRLRLQTVERQQREDLQAAVDQRTTELRQALMAANEASHAKTDFLARVSHDLRSPLTSIMGYAQLLQRVGGLASQHARFIRRSANHMLVLVNDLIEYARGINSEQPEPMPVYINGWLDGVAREALVLAERRRNRFVLRLEQPLPPVLVTDAKRLRQMLINLLDNAAKFTTDGTVELRVSAERQPHVAGAAETLELVLAVSDTGMGIAPADQGQLFEPFYRTASAAGVPGVGLGLSIVQIWAERMGGAVALESAPGQGATFTLRLPMAVGHEAQMSPALWQDDIAYLPVLEGGGRRIWVVEDSADIRDMLAEELRSTGFVVETAANGTAFLEQMLSSPNAMPPSLVLTDYLMPGADGKVVLHGVRRHWPGVPVVLLSATHLTMDQVDAGREQGFDASLMKPVNLADLRLTLARLLGLRCSDDPSVTPAAVLARDAERDLARESVKLRQPPVAELEQAMLWVEMGALTDLTEWADDLTQRYPECAEFVQRLRSLLAQAHFDGIRVLCQLEELA